MKQKVLLIVGILLTISLAVGLLNQPTVDDVMFDFHLANDRAEEMLIDPLILHRDLIKERVIQDVQNPAMDKRRYAIGFLGVAKIHEALPALEQILQNEQELDCFRADALVSVFQIHDEKGKALSRTYFQRNGYLGWIAAGLLDGSHIPFTRTKFEAFFGSKY